MDQTPQIDQEEMEEMIFSTVDLDLLLQMFESETKDSSLPPIDNPVEDCGPQQPQTGCCMPLGVAPLSLQQQVLPTPGFHTAQTGLPHPPPHDAPANGGFGPQQPQTDCHMPLGAAPLSLLQGVMPAPGFHAAQTGFPFLPPYNAPAQKNFGPQQPQTECYMPLGVAPLRLQQQVLPTPGFHAAQTGLPHFPPHDAPANGGFGPQQPQTDCHMPPGAALLSLQQPVLPAPGFHTAQTGLPHPPPHDAPANGGLGPQQPQTDCHMPLGAAPLSLLQGVMPAPGFHAAQTGFPFLPPYNAPAKENFGPQQPQTEFYMPMGVAPLRLQQQVLPTPGFHAAQTGLPHFPPHGAPANGGFGPQQPQTEFYMPLGVAPLRLQQQVLPTPGFHAAQTGLLHPPPHDAPANGECYMPLGAAPFSLQQPVMPAPGLAPPMYQPPTILPNYMFPQAAPFIHSQVNNGPVVSHPQGLGMNPAPVGFKNGVMVYGAPTFTAPPVASDVPVVKAQASKKKRCYTKSHDESKPYIKKPPNAFMLFRMELRPNVVAELQTSECATVNKVIGQRWKSLSKEEQTKYYERADFERQLHNQLFPEWSNSDNYGKKRRRIRRKCLSTAEKLAI
ncbi:protein capicua homolog [Paralichthys olivaceus]|uniref:protein capicua homolog n=1 Tax=Paralichthys olivaceus TaxID=8255 RepID=UPI00375043F7